MNDRERRAAERCERIPDDAKLWPKWMADDESKERREAKWAAQTEKVVDEWNELTVDELKYLLACLEVADGDGEGHDKSFGVEYRNVRWKIRRGIEAGAMAPVARRGSK